MWLVANLIAILFSIPSPLVGNTSPTASGTKEEPREGAPIGPEETIYAEQLSLDAAIQSALQNNLGILIERYAPIIARDDIEAARSTFDPVITTGFDASNRSSPTAASALDGSPRPETSNRTFSAGVSQRLASGATIGASTGINRYGSNSSFSLINPDYTSDLSFSLRQPLLRGFGSTINLAPIARAQSRLRQSEFQLRQVVQEVVAETEIRYWDLAAAKARKAFYQLSLDLAESLLEETREREKLGLATNVDVLQAEASRALRTEDLILAQQAIEDNEDRLRNLIGTISPDPEPSLLVATLPEIDPELPPFSDILQTALANNIQTHIQHQVIRQSQIDREVARNNRLPNLDVVAGGGLLGRTDSANAAFRNSLHADGHVWNAGIQLSFPWGLREGNARYRQASRQAERAHTQLARIQQELLLQLRTAWRNVAAAKQRVQSTGASVLLNEESYDRERARYESGLATLRNVLEAQRDLDDARLRYLEAATDLLRGTIRLSLLDGTLLSRHGFSWDEIDELGESAPKQAPVLLPTATELTAHQ